MIATYNLGMQRSLSIKELRNRLPEILEHIQNGITYTLIYRSHPVGQIGPVQDDEKPTTSKNSLAFFTNPKNRIKFKTKKTAVQMVREERD